MDTVYDLIARLKRCEQALKMFLAPSFARRLTREFFCDFCDFFFLGKLKILCMVICRKSHKTWFYLTVIE